MTLAAGLAPVQWLAGCVMEQQPCRRRLARREARGRVELRQYCGQQILGYLDVMFEVVLGLFQLPMQIVYVVNEPIFQYQVVGLFG